MEMPFQADDTAPVFSIGHHDSHHLASVELEELSNTQDLGYDFATTPITSIDFHTRTVALLEDYLHRLDTTERDSIPPLKLPPLDPLASTLKPHGSNSALIGLVSPWIDLGSRDATVASISRQVLNLEVAYAAFCGFNNIIIPKPSSGADAVQYARDVREALGLGPCLQLHVLFPMTGELDIDHGYSSHLSEFARPPLEEGALDEHDGKDLFDSWEVWNTIRTICGYSQKLSVALEIPRQLPKAILLSRWYSEPVRILAFPHPSFLRNAKGYPVLPKQHQHYISRFARLRFPPWLLLCDVVSHGAGDSKASSISSADPTPAEASSRSRPNDSRPTLHLEYLRHLQQTQPTPPPIEIFGRGYEDFLQSPLQPLADNLESITYEGFEKDPIKYEWYERAIEAALKDLASSAQETGDLIVAIAGAGRGPLVTRALQASKATGIAIQCWAVEKNPNALVLLQRRNATDSLWNSQVHVVKADMRHWNGPTASNGTAVKVDILVSELLGSFADNELSPECLDGAQHVLHPHHGINIPQSYSAHLTPISTPRIYADLLSRSGTEKWELPYVVMLHQYDYLCADPQSESLRLPQVQTAWQFSHPMQSHLLENAQARAGGRLDAGGWAGGDGTNEHNSRTCTVTFTSADAGVCHGLAGYFESVLYSSATAKVEISTNPATIDAKSKDMISWFPIFFPLKVCLLTMFLPFDITLILKQTPIYVPANSEIAVSLWRQTDDRSVWYEWLVEVFDVRSNRRTRIAMSDLHSSRKNACLT